MLSEHKLKDLIGLVRHRYPDWEDFEHPKFVTDEIEPKLAIARRAGDLLAKSSLDRLIGREQFDEFLEQVEQVIAADSVQLLWRQVPSAGDTAVLHAPDLDKPTFCTQFRNLLHGDRKPPQRLQSFSDYLQRHELPNKWPFPTYFLFFCHPDDEIFIKPNAATWFLRYMGENERVAGAPDGDTYSRIREQVRIVSNFLLDYGADDMIDVQSFLWVCYRESKARIGRLDTRGQVELDVPETIPDPPVDYEIGQGTKELREGENYLGEKDVRAHYSLKEFSGETGFDEAELARWGRAIERKGQIVLYGPPGTGKTFMARKLARHLIGGGRGFAELVQFHPAYAYEDFIQGIRPTTREDGGLRYEMVYGRFRQFCRRARSLSSDDVCVFIIDELNRANVASVFGELMYLLEYRDDAVRLAAGNEPFTIPGNVRIIGTMNTADRSIALVDHALRRRFAFIHLPPNFDALRRFHQRHETEFPVEALIAVLQNLNNAIGDPHYHLGITFFLQTDLADQIADVWRMEIEPYLEEYFFDRPEKIEPFCWQRVKAQLT